MSDRIVIAMVGLPARGKSYISKAIVRYLNFLGCPARLFNAGNKRRQEGNAGVDANFFDASNLDAKAQRERMAMETLDELLEWLHSETRPESGCACGAAPFGAVVTSSELAALRTHSSGVGRARAQCCDRVSGWRGKLGVAKRNDMHCNSIRRQGRREADAHRQGHERATLPLMPWQSRAGGWTCDHSWQSHGLRQRSQSHHSAPPPA